MTDTVERFSNRVANYVKYRPDYPREIVAYLTANGVLNANSVIADVGCGTGISTRMFLENGNPVLGVEPNQAMRGAAVEYLAEFSDFRPIDGRSDATTLGDDSVDMIVSAQAFHWFEPDATRREFERILKPNGSVVLIWNERSLDADEFHVDYEALLLRYATDYGTIRHENITGDELKAFFRRDYETATFANEQVFDFEGIKGRMLSSSYMPSESSPSYQQVVDELAAVFAKHERSGRIKVLYDTKVYHSSIK